MRKVMNSPRSPYPVFNRNELPRHADNVRLNKNPHAVALGSMTSKAKAEAAVKNGQKGGNPKNF